MKAASSWLACTTTQARLGSIEAIMESILECDDDAFRELVLHISRMGGKKLRPSLYLLAASFGDYYDKALLLPAAALELIHISSLYHDDVMDRSSRRRNAPSANMLWGNTNAIQAGVYLYSKAAEILSSYGMNTNKLTCRYIADLCLGQLKEAENAYNVSLEMPEHFTIIRQKTASLFELPCLLGASLSDASDTVVNALTTYGLHTGIAFQLVDDILDLKGNQEKTGKIKGTDIKEGVYSCATLHTLRSSVGKQLEKYLLVDEITSTDIIKAIDLIEASGGFEIAKKEAVYHCELAKEALEILPGTAARQSLLNLTDFILTRDT